MNFNIKFQTKKNNNFILIALILFLAGLLLAYLGFNICQSIFYKDAYDIDFSKKNFKNQNIPLFIDENFDSPKFFSFGKINKIHYAEIANSPVSFVFQPKEFPLNKTMEITSYFMGESDWEISLDCEICPKNQKYQWRPFSREILKNDYLLATNFNNLYIYSQKNKPWEKEKDVNLWIIKNIKPNSSLKIINNVYPISKLTNPDIGYQAGSQTIIKKRLRGEHQFYVYLENEINLEIEKKDLNWYEGHDEVIIKLFGLDGNAVFEKIIKDDGITEANREIKTETIKKTINRRLKNGVYLLEFKETGANKSDWVIQSLKINTNKIVLTGKNNLILDPTELYTEFNETKKIKANIWHKWALQTIWFASASQNMSLPITKKELNTWQSIELPPGQYVIDVCGDQRLSGANFAFSSANYFKPFMYDLTKNEKPSFVIADFYQRQNNAWTKVSRQFTSEEIARLSDFKSIKFSFKNVKLNKKNQKEKELFNQGFTVLEKFNEYKLYGKKKLKPSGQKVNDLASWLANLLPPDSSLYIDKLIIPNDQGILANINIKDSLDADFALIKDAYAKPTFIKKVEVNIK